MKHFIIDNGAYTIKAGYAGGTSPRPSITHNAIVRSRDGMIHIGSEYLSHSNQFSGMIFKRPHEQGNLTQWEVERPIWDIMLESSKVDPSDTQLTLTETPFQLPQLSINTDQMVFEEYGFAEYYRCIPPSLVPWTAVKDENEQGGGEIEGKNESIHQNKKPKQSKAKPKKNAVEISPPDFSLIIDAGYNCTWIIPVIYQNVYWRGARKFPVGGKTLNGLLREIISFRHYDVTDETILVNTIKEASCFVAQDYHKTLLKAGDHSCEFVLPDFKTTTTGYIRKPNQALPAETQTLKLTDERFTIPESFYHPEILFNSATANSSKIFSSTFKNLIDLVIESVMSCPEVARPLITANISVVGGTSKLPNFVERLQLQLLRELPSDWPIRFITSQYDPIETAWHGGANLASLPILNDVTISKQEYFEHGSNWCQRQFGFKYVS